jgi:hypothetical protein
MARVKSAVEEGASTPSAAEAVLRKIDDVRVGDMDGKRNILRRQEANNLPTYIPLEAVAYVSNHVKKAVA